MLFLVSNVPLYAAKRSCASPTFDHVYLTESVDEVDSQSVFPHKFVNLFFIITNISRFELCFRVWGSVFEVQGSGFRV